MAKHYKYKVLRRDVQLNPDERGGRFPVEMPKPMMPKMPTAPKMPTMPKAMNAESMMAKGQAMKTNMMAKAEELRKKRKILR